MASRDGRKTPAHRGARTIVQRHPDEISVKPYPQGDSLMAIPAGTHKLGPDNATLSVKTGRRGAAAKAGHDLVIHVTSWEGTLDADGDPAVTLSADGGSLRVHEGSGGAKALSDDDKENIQGSIDKDILKKATITFASTAVTPTDAGLSVTGDLKLNGKTKPITFDLVVDGEALSGTANLTQSDFGMKPFSALFGALKVTDEIEIVINGNLA
jgi:polyisoprenoid-binding protein YceI